MARDLRVNASPGSDEETELSEGFPDPGFEVHPSGDALKRGRLSIGSARRPSHPARNASLGPCLYLGPRGQRCARPAIDDGFCEKHRPGEKVAGSLVGRRVLGAVVAVLGILWPYVADLVREIIRWFQHH